MIHYEFGTYVLTNQLWKNKVKKKKTVCHFVWSSSSMTVYTF